MSLYFTFHAKVWGLIAVDIVAIAALRSLPSLANEFAVISAPLLLIIGVALAFFGRKFAKALIFIAGGLVGAAAGFAIVAFLFGEAVALFGALAGFLIVGLIAYALAQLAFGIILASTLFFLTEMLIPNLLIAVVIATIGLILGILMYNKFLSIATAVAGGLMVFQALNALNISNMLALIVGIVVIIAGAITQFRQLEKKK